MSIDDWLAERNLSSKKLISTKRGEDFHHVLFSQDGLTRLIVRKVSVDSLTAYRSLPPSIQVDISSVSPVFSDGSVLVEFVDRRDSYGKGFTGLELTGEQREPKFPY